MEDMKISPFDKEWNRIVSNIIENGEVDNNSRAIYNDGTSAQTKFTIGEKMFFDGTELPLPHNKFIPLKNPLRELFWIWIKKSNKVQELRDMGTQIWDNWEIKSGYWKGTIGPAYGYQLGLKCRKVPLDQIHWDKLDPREISQYKIRLKLSKERFLLLDQVDYLIHSLINNPNSRRNIVSLWNINNLDQMSLEPCVWKTNWIVSKNKLNLIVGIRSNDMCLGNPFNVYQYYILQRLIAQVVNLEPGTIQFDIDNAHVYLRHIDEAKKQINYVVENYSKPSLWINPNIKNLYEFDVENDIKIFEFNQGPKRKFEIAK